MDCSPTYCFPGFWNPFTIFWRVKITAAMESMAPVRQATNQIVMNCADIDIITASYAPEGDE
ncbi:hypothetical protein CB1_000261042, partial [Camelus ferus]